MKYILVIISCLFVMTACSSGNETPIPEDTASYYVKYEVNSKFGNRVTASQTIKFTTEKGVESYKQESRATTSMNWEGTYGPFKKGDFISLSVSNSIMDIHGRIYISREKEPFVIKAEGSGKKNLNLQTTIDF